MELHKDFKFLSIYWLPIENVVIMKWKSFASGEDFRGGLNEGLNVIKSHKSSKWLADLRDLGTVPKLDQDWSNVDWFPRAVIGGIKKMAIIMPKSVLSSMSVRNILTEMDGKNIETNYFETESEAIAWLAN
jgi:hypothetical protein